MVKRAPDEKGKSGRRGNAGSDEKVGDGAGGRGDKEGESRGVTRVEKGHEILSIVDAKTGLPEEAWAGGKGKA